MALALLVDDDSEVLGPLSELIESQGFEVEVAATVEEARARMQARVPDVLLIDLVLPDGNGLDLLTESASATRVVLITGHATVDTAVEALRQGATDYLTKPIELPRLQRVLSHVFEAKRLNEQIGSMRSEVQRAGRFGTMVGISTAMLRVYDLIGRVAPTEATVLLTGESGTGKEVAAQTLHGLSRRREEPFFPLNCGAVSPSLIESELFGHERGSFTGAERLHKGYFERATGGTLFLDEITEMPVELQVKLLRVLETGVVMRIGGERPIEVDVRVIAATNRDPEQAVANGKLREDLLYRLRVFPVHMPPLRDRGDDIEVLAHHFLQELNRAEATGKVWTPAALKRLRRHDWPGNVRELKNLVHHAYILADEEILHECVPLGPEEPMVLPQQDATQSADLHLRIGVTIAEADRRLILSTLDRFGGDKKKAAEVLGVSVKTVYNRLNQYRRSTRFRESSVG